MENLINGVNNEIDRNAQDFDNSDSVNLSLSKEDVLTISSLLYVYCLLNTSDKASKDNVFRLYRICENIGDAMCFDDEIVVENDAVVYKHG